MSLRDQSDRVEDHYHHRYRLTVVLTMAVACPTPCHAQLATGPPGGRRASGDLTITRGVKVPMKDGISLVGDLFRPGSAPAPVPVVLARTPYGRKIEGTLYGEFFAKHGYAFMAQDVRGRFDSEGLWTPFQNERSDGVDTIEWLVKQPWCNGDIAIFGASYGAMCAWQAAAAAPPRLRAVIAMVNVADPDQFMPFNGGAFHIGFAAWAKLLEAIEQPGGAATIGVIDWDGAVRTRPLKHLDTFFGTTHSYVDEMLATPLSDRQYWRSLGYDEALANAKVAGLHITGWYDVHRKGTFSAYERLRKSAMTSEARDSQYLIVGPWAHLGVNRNRTMGSADFGDQSLVDLNGMMIRFLDHHIKQTSTFLPNNKRVQLFVPGPNHWEYGSAWPLNAAENRVFRLASTGRANTRYGGGLLQLSARSETSTQHDEYVYDPNDPPGFQGCFALYPIPEHVSDKSASLDRPDVLDYTSQAFEETAHVIGTPGVVLFVSTDAADTDIAVELFRLTPDGKMYHLTSGIQRIRFRKGYDQDDPVTSGRVVRIVVDCPPVGVQFQEGDRLHLQIGSAGTPAFAPHLNTLEPLHQARHAVRATNRVWHTPEYDSHVKLPFARILN